MKRLLLALSFLTMGGMAHAANSSLVVSSGTFKAIDGFDTAGSQFRQAITIADPSVVANVAPVDAVKGLSVYLASSTAEVGNVKNSGTFAVQAAQSGAFVITGTTVGITDSGGSITVDNAGTFAVQAAQGVAGSAGWPVTSTYTVVSSTYSLAVNQTQINSVTVSAGSGVNGTGVQRVTVATDQVPYGVMFSTVAVDRVGTEIVWVSTFANVAASQTDSALVGAVASKMICVHMLSAVAGGTATNLTFNSKPAGAGTAISPLYANAANGGEVLPYAPIPWFCSTAGEGLTVTTGAGSTTGILVKYMTH